MIGGCNSQVTVAAAEVVRRQGTCRPRWKSAAAVVLGAAAVALGAAAAAAAAVALGAAAAADVEVDLHDLLHHLEISAASNPVQRGPPPTVSL